MSRGFGVKDKRACILALKSSLAIKTIDCSLRGIGKELSQGYGKIAE